jgi:hypothetical protein
LLQREDESLTPFHSGFISEYMDHRTPHNASPTQNTTSGHAGDKKRADALRQNLLKRKQQARARDGSAVLSKTQDTSKEK